jgi:signal peptidase
VTDLDVEVTDLDAEVTDEPVTEKRSTSRSLARALRRGIGWGLLAVVAGLAVLVIGIPVATGSTPLTVLTGSMEPTLPPGTLVVVRPTPAREIGLGDVLTYQIEPGKPAVVSHRVVEVRSVSNGTTEFITKGDNNNAADPAPVQEAQIKGTVWYSIPLVGWASIAAGQYRAWLLPLVGVALLGYAAAMIGSGLLAKARAARGARAAATALDPVPPLAD